MSYRTPLDLRDGVLRPSHLSEPHFISNLTLDHCCHPSAGALAPAFTSQAIAGAAMGCLMCYGSKVGWYHRVFLPVIVLEIARRHGSIWGTIDLCALCMVAAGVQRADSRANAVLPRPAYQARVPRRSRALSGSVVAWVFALLEPRFIHRTASFSVHLSRSRCTVAVRSLTSES